jgi:antitoxin component YwqK of YwqJK toxin-antitoxin module
MIYRILIIALLLGFTSCKTEKSEETVESTQVEAAIENNTEEITPVVDKKDLIVVENGMYKEYYEDKRSIKFEGPQDENGKRHGRWQYFSKEGVELSMTMYDHGNKHGHSIVKYPNGNLHYTGEYSQNKQVGIWRTYSTEGKLINEVDYNKL